MVYFFAFTLGYAMFYQSYKMKIKALASTFIVVFLSSLLLSSCASTTVKVPNWYNNAVLTTNTDMISSVGQGRSLQEAKKIALEQISSQIWVKLSSSSESSDTQIVTEQNNNAKSYNRSRFANEINTKTAGIVFTDVNFSKVEKLDGVYYVLANVKRESIIKQLKMEVVQLNDKANVIINKQKYKNAFIWYVDNANFYQTKNQAQIKVNILNALKCDDIPSLAAINTLMTKLGKVKSQLVVGISSNNASISKAIANKLTKKEIKTSFGNGFFVTNHLNLHINSENKKIGDIYVTTLFITLEFTDKSQHILMSNDVVVSGNSITNYRISKKAATEKFIDEIKNKSIYDLFAYGEYH